MYARGLGLVNNDENPRRDGNPEIRKQIGKLKNGNDKTKNGLPANHANRRK